MKKAEKYMNKLNSSNVVFSALKRVVEDSETWELVSSIDCFWNKSVFILFLVFMASVLKVSICLMIFLIFTININY